MKSLSLLFLIAVIDCSVAQTPNVQAVAYSRSTTPGIPTGLGGPAINSLPVRYYIYVAVEKGTPVSVSSVCLKGQSYSASLNKVTSPVVVPHDPNASTEVKDILVPKTQDEVYQVNVQEQTGPACEVPDVAGSTLECLLDIFERHFLSRFFRQVSEPLLCRGIHRRNRKQTEYGNKRIRRQDCLHVSIVGYHQFTRKLK